MCRTSSNCDSNKGSCKMLKITKPETVKVRSWSTLRQFSRVFRSELSSAFSSLRCSSAKWKKIIFTFGKFHHRTTFSFKTPEFHVMNDAYSVSKEIIWEKKIPMALILSVCFWDNTRGKTALSRLTRHSLLHTHTKRETQLIDIFLSSLSGWSQQIAHTTVSAL